MYLITGGAGFLGSQIVKSLPAKEKIRVLALPEDPLVAYLPRSVEIIKGDLLNKSDLECLFTFPTQEPIVVIHCASIITMSMVPVQKVWDINVQGTENIIEQCEKHSARKLIYVSTVHSIEELPQGQIMKEPKNIYPQRVVGYYAQTKAKATQRIMNARQKGLRANIVYPSGLFGPGDYARGNLTQLFLDYLDGRIPAGVPGGYNFADVRDVAQAIVRLATGNFTGEDYILAGEYISIMNILKEFAYQSGKKPIRFQVPIWLARLALPLLNRSYKKRGVKSVFSNYSLYTIGVNSHFSSQKAKQQLGYVCRPFSQTIADTANWLRENYEQLLS